MENKYRSSIARKVMTENGILIPSLQDRNISFDLREYLKEMPQYEKLLNIFQGIGGKERDRELFDYNGDVTESLFNIDPGLCPKECSVHCKIYHNNGSADINR
jgi:hypothetical protein